MLKKISHISISILLLIATTGLTISNHYCNHSLAQLEEKTEQSTCCDTNADCCHKEVQTLRIDNEFESTKFIADISSDAILVSRLINDAEIEYFYSFKAINHVDGPPPLITLDFLSDIQVFLL